MRLLSLRLRAFRGVLRLRDHRAWKGCVMKRGPISAIFQCGLTFTLVLGLAVVATPGVQAQTLSVLYSFTGGSDGMTPLSGLTSAGKATFYGTTSAGGSGSGTLFKLEPSGSGWTLNTIHTFTSNPDGATPIARVRVRPGGIVYGTTSAGGTSGAGTVYEMSSKGESVIYEFLGGSDGSQPSPGDLAFDHAGNIYGTTSGGGANGNGTVYELVRSKKGAWKEKLLYSFRQSSDGTVPVGGVTFGTPDTLYGTTSTGGTYGYGTVYQLKRSGSTWTETILYNFQDGVDGGTPYAGVIRDKSGNLYGGVVSGGTGGGGTVFELTPKNGVWSYAVLYNILGWAVSGPFRNLVQDASGNLYGTTHCDGNQQFGTVFELTPSNGTWTEAWEYDFQGGTGGNFLFSNPVLDEQGNVYGTASDGGPNYGQGMVFKITP
jgi:uncharacterized repeat protein (TIGR03803 family)